LLKNTYRIDYALGRGGFGITYRAMHKDLELPVAIKEFYPQEHALREGKTGQLIVPNTKQDIYQRNLVRFLREGKTLARLNHPNVVQVRDYSQDRNTAYLVMELIKGKTLQDELNEQPGKKLPLARVKELVSHLVNALTAIHAQEVYHLDIKPENILITPENRLVVVDFGASRQGLGSSSTQAYTEDYAAPEVIAGRDVGAHSDLFELGMMLHEMLTGKRPPTAVNRLMDDNWSPVELSEPWRGLVEVALQIKPEKRPRSVQSWWSTFLEFEERGRRLEEERRRQEVEARRRREAEERQRQEEQRRQQDKEERRRREAEEKARAKAEQQRLKKQREIQAVEERNRRKSTTNFKESRQGKKEILLYYLLPVSLLSGLLAFLDQPVVMMGFLLGAFTHFFITWHVLDQTSAGLKGYAYLLLYIAAIVFVSRFVEKTFVSNQNVSTRHMTGTEMWILPLLCAIGFFSLFSAYLYIITEKLQKYFSEVQVILISLGTSGLGLGLTLLGRFLLSR
jgi:serine/threonine protein kinase